MQSVATKLNHWYGFEFKRKVYIATVYVKNFVVYLISWFSWMIKIHDFFHEKSYNAQNLLNFIVTSRVQCANE